MAEGILDRLPDLTGLVQTSGSVESGLGALISIAGASAGQTDSPVAAVLGAIQGVSAKLSVDVSGLTTRFPAALTVMQNALAPDSIAFVRSIETGYKQAQGFLGDSPLARAIGEGHTLQDAALGFIGETLRTFEQKHTDLAQRVIDPGALQAVTSALSALGGFRTDFNAHRAEFLPFLGKNLLGVAPDLFAAPLGHLTQFRTALGPLDPAAIETALNTARQAVATGFRDLVASCTAFDPADVNAYAQIDVQLGTVEVAIHGLGGALAPVYRQASAAVEAFPWDSFFPRLRELLEAVTIPAPSFSADELVRGVSGVLDPMLGRLQATFGPTELTGRIEALTRAIQDAFQNSPLTQVRRALRDFLDQIRQAIEAVPVGQVQKAVEDILNRIKTEIDSLGLAQIANGIEQGFRDLEKYVTDNIDAALKEQVRAAVQKLIADLQGLPIETLASNLDQVISQVQSLIEELETALSSGLDELSEAAAKLEELSFKPVGDAVIGEIDDVKARLRKIDPNALSDIEKLALKGAFAILQAIDLEGLIANEVKKGFKEAQGAALSVLDELKAVLETLRARLEQYQPKQLIGSLTALLEKSRQAVEALTAPALMKPAYDLLEDLSRRASALSPGALLSPLEQPYDGLMSGVRQLDPSQLIAPLTALYAEIDKLIAKVDVTPVLEELDRRQKALFASIRASLLSTLDGLSLPEPLGGFLKQLRPVLEAMTDALFGNPDAELKKISLDVKGRFRFSTLLEPLDKAFDQLVDMLASVPETDLVDTVNAIRAGVGVALDALDPRRLAGALRAAQGRVDELSPPGVFAMPLSLPSVRAAFQVRVEGAPVAMQASITATLARFDAVIRVADPAATELTALHGTLADSLRRAVRSFDASGAEEAYGKLRSELDRVVPDFLRGTEPLTQAEIIAGVQSLRPSRHVEPLDRLFDRFLAQLKPLEAALEPAINGFFQALRDSVMLLNPLSLKDSVAQIYQTIRDKVRILDPDRLAASLRTALFDPLMTALGALDPAALKTRLDVVFQSAVRAVSTNIREILDGISTALDEKLKALRDALAGRIKTIEDAINSAAGTFQRILDRVEALVLVEILERLRKAVQTLGVSFGQEVDRVRQAFDDMIAAIPLGGGASVSARAA
jgi:uncharacterized protein (DUF2267 family)